MTNEIGILGVGVSGIALVIKEKVPDLSSVKLIAAVFTIWAVPSSLILYFTGFVQNFELPPEISETMDYLAFLTIIETDISMLLYYKHTKNRSQVFSSP